MKKVALKICGMNQNTSEVAMLQPDYLGFIFYDKSPRDFSGEIPSLPKHIKKVGVFVNASLEEISEKIKKYNLDVIQLHGEESPTFCEKLRDAITTTVEVPVLSAVEEPVLSAVEVPVLSAVEVWKVFSIKDSFNFDLLTPFENKVDKFLFDTKGKEKGGNGYVFDWRILENYPSKKPFILSGGIGLNEIEKLKSILKSDLPIHAIDVNSKFESEPGLKNTDDLKQFMQELQTED
ncbi:phosphoribosylanthranilate isomerase [Ulvibacter antarcticus]|uniref:N-(5'-phosphoribosyl)anthranilate isomerase n=1 Tax=Ulvibacter antarcticus TaxID=442714 RepID=A0A3L9YFT4_9FLAO|nr:phosphoribosylanthranilate isomerase [Ulvibacter antarcticus]RMA56798.1 phosphoribosylanthranilate isomerase [Ulvibacter antarcticus]